MLEHPFSESRRTWSVHPGYSKHFTTDRALFKTYTAWPFPSPIVLNSLRFYALECEPELPHRCYNAGGMGNVELVFANGKKLLIPNVIHIVDRKFPMHILNTISLIELNKLTPMGHSIAFVNTSGGVHDQDGIAPIELVVQKHSGPDEGLRSFSERIVERIGGGYTYMVPPPGKSAKQSRHPRLVAESYVLEEDAKREMAEREKAEREKAEKEQEAKVNGNGKSGTKAARMKNGFIDGDELTELIKSKEWATAEVMNPRVHLGKW